MQTRGALILLIFALTVAFSPQLAEARKAEIVDAAVDRDAEMVTIGFRVEGAFSDSIIEAIQTGAPTSFTYVIQLYRGNKSEPDEHLFTRRLERTIQYDTLRQHYLITGDGPQKIAEDWAGAERLMTIVQDVPVALTSGMDDADEYYVMIKAELEEVRLPFVFSFLRLFVQLWDFETRWTRIDLPKAAE